MIYNTVKLSYLLIRGFLSFGWPYMVDFLANLYDICTHIDSLEYLLFLSEKYPVAISYGD